MWFLFILIGILIGGGASYYFFVVRGTVQSIVDTDTTPVPADPQVALVKARIESAHYAAFGPAGMPDTAKDKAFNLLWKWAGQSESGMPRG